MSDFRLNSQANQFIQRIGINQDQFNKAIKGHEAELDANGDHTLDEKEVAQLFGMEPGADTQGNALAQRAVHDIQANQFDFKAFTSSKAQGQADQVNTQMNQWVVTDGEAHRSRQDITGLDPASFGRTLERLKPEACSRFVKEMPTEDLNKFADACKRNLSPDKLTALYSRLDDSAKSLLQGAVNRERTLGTWHGRLSDATITSKGEIGSGYNTREEALQSARRHQGAEAIVQSADGKFHVHAVDTHSSYAFTRDNVAQVKGYSVSNVSTANSDDEFHDSQKIVGFTTEDDFEMNVPGQLSGDRFLIDQHIVSPLKDPQTSPQQAFRALSEEAVHYTQGQVLHSSNRTDGPVNLAADVLNSIPMLAFRAWVPPDSVENVKAIADKAKSTKFGNCQENACVGAMRLAEQGTPNVEVYGFLGRKDSKPHHAFVVIGRDPNSDSSRPETWGPNCVVCDPYFGITYSPAEMSQHMSDAVYPDVQCRVTDAQGAILP